MTPGKITAEQLAGEAPDGCIILAYDEIYDQYRIAVHSTYGVWYEMGAKDPATDPDDLAPLVGADILTPISRLYDMAERCDALTNLRDHYKRTANALYSITERAVQAAMTAERADTDEARLLAYQAMRGILGEIITLEARAAA